MLKTNLSQRSLQQVLVISFALLSISAIFSLATLHAYSTYQTTRTALHQALSKTSQIVALRADGYVSKITTALTATTATQREFLSSDNASVRRTALTRILATHRDVRAVWALSTNGLAHDFVSRYQITTEAVIDSLWAPSVSPSDKRIGYRFSKVRFTKTAKEPLINVVIPVMRGTSIYQGSVVATLSLKYLRDLLADLELENRQKAYIYHSDGTLIGHSDSRIIFLDNAIPPDVLSLFFSPSNTSTQEYKVSGGREMISGFSLMNNLGFGIIVAAPKSNAIEAAVGGILYSIVISIIVLIVSVFTGQWLARVIVTPVQNLSQMAEEMANTSTASEVVIAGTIETQKLGIAFNKMTIRLESTISELKSQIRSREKSEQALRESEERFRAIAENLPEIFWLGSLDQQNRFRLIYVNPAFEQVWQHKRDDIYQDPSLWFTCINPQDKKRMQAAFLLFCQGKRALNEVFRITPPDGIEKTIGVTGSLIKDEFGYITRVTGILRDITEIKNTEQALRRTQKMDAIGQLTGGIAHDFNNILGIILGNLDLLEHQLKENSSPLKRVATIKKSAQRATDLTRQLLRFSHHQATQVSSTNINRVILEMDSLIARSVTPQVEVTRHFAKDLWQTEIDSGDFEDALLNLIINARDAMPDGGQLTIESSNQTLDAAYCDQNSEVTQGDYVQLAVSDNGEGIPATQLEKIFEPFFTTKSRDKGTGLGLSMVFGFVKRSKGHIKVYSEPGTGTVFRILLPRSHAVDNQGKAHKEPKMALPRGHETVLVVDDEPALLELAQDALQALGYRVLTASNGQNALDQLALTPAVSLLFSDIVMPGGIDGYELAEQATARYPKLKVLLTSGYTEKMEARNGQARFSTNLLSKPYSQAELAQRIRLMLGKNIPHLPHQQKKLEPTDPGQTRNFQSGVDLLDSNYNVLKKLLKQCDKTKNGQPNPLENIVTELAKHTATHFRREESIMEVCGYPGLANHRKVHHLLSRQLEEKQKKSKQHTLSRDELKLFLVCWIEDHLNSMDSTIVPYCKGKEALISRTLKQIEQQEQQEPNSSE